MVLLQVQGALQSLSEAELKALKRRKLVAVENWTTFRLAKGPNFALKRKEVALNLTADMLQRSVRSCLVLP